MYSTALRCWWMLEEIGNPYEKIIIDHRIGDNKSIDYLQINPNGKVPAFDGGLGNIITESMAINLYLSRLYGLSRTDLNIWQSSIDSARVMQWSFWVVREIEPFLLKLLYSRSINRENSITDTKYEDLIYKPLCVLDDYLMGGDYILGDEFTVVDLNVSSIIGWCGRAKVKTTEFPAIQRWATRCFDRPALKRACNNEERFFL